MLQQIEANIVFEGVIIRWQTRSWRLKRMPVIGLTQELRSDCSKSFSNCRRLDSHFQYCRTQYWTQATSMQDADCSTTCTTKFEPSLCWDEDYLVEVNSYGCSGSLFSLKLVSMPQGSWFWAARTPFSLINPLGVFGFPELGLVSVSVIPFINICYGRWDRHGTL